MSRKYIFTYQTKNLVNGKTYVGVHTTSNLEDGYIGCGIRSQAYAEAQYKKSKTIPLINAVVKYKYKNFKSEILSFWDTEEDAYTEEIFLVDKTWVKDENNYNVSLGGNGGFPFKYKGEKHPSAKINKKTATEIIKYYNSGNWSATEMAKYFEIPATTISPIIRGINWTHLEDKIIRKKYIKKKLSDKISTKETSEIRQLYSTGKQSYLSLSKKFGHSIQTIKEVIKYVSKPNQDLDIKPDIDKVLDGINNSKVSKETCTLIRETYIKEDTSCKKLGLQFNLTPQHIHRFLQYTIRKNQDLDIREEIKSIRKSKDKFKKL